MTVLCKLCSCLFELFELTFSVFHFPFPVKKPVLLFLVNFIVDFKCSFHFSDFEPRFRFLAKIVKLSFLAFLGKVGAKWTVKSSKAGLQQNTPNMARLV